MDLNTMSDNHRLREKASFYAALQILEQHYFSHYFIEPDELHFEALYRARQEIWKLPISKVQDICFSCTQKYLEKAEVMQQADYEWEVQLKKEGVDITKGQEEPAIDVCVDNNSGEVL